MHGAAPESAQVRAALDATVLPTPGPSIAWDDEAFRRWLGGQVVGMLEGVFTE